MPSEEWLQKLSLLMMMIIIIIVIIIIIIISSIAAEKLQLDMSNNNGLTSRQRSSKNKIINK
jgi:competence protein ComGC